MKKSLSILLTVLLIFSTMAFAMPVSAADEPTVVDSGTCGADGDGTNLTWKLTSDGVLTISGEGSMQNYSLVIVPSSNQTSWTNTSSSPMYGNSAIKRLVVEEGVTSLGNLAFLRCTNLKDVVLPTSLDTVVMGAFGACSALTDVYYAGSETQWNQITIVETATMDGDVLLRNANIHYNVVGCGTCGDNITWTLADGVLTISGEGAMVGALPPEEINGVCRTRAPWGEYYESIQTVVVESGVTHIGSYAFYGCRNLTDFSLADSVKYVGRSAFAFCKSLTSITIPASVEDWGDSVFEGCTALNSVTFPETFTQGISMYMFCGCTALTSIELPNGTTSIGKYAFSGCSQLAEITFPETLRSVGAYAFQGTPWLAAQPDGFLYINNVLVMYKGTMPEHTHVTVREGTTSISGYAFKDCSGLVSITLPDTLREIGPCAFVGCSNLKEIVLPEGYQWIDYTTFSGSYGLVSIYIPASTTMICKTAFSSCPNLENVFYGGTQEQWNQIRFTEGIDDALENANMHYNATGNSVHTNPQNVAATNPTTTAHGHTAGVYCPDCETWLSGHEVIHNQLGDRTVVKEATETEEGEVIITCTVCNEQGLYALEKLPHTDSEQEDTSFIGRLRAAAKGVINFFLRLIRWLGGKK